MSCTPCKLNAPHPGLLGFLFDRSLAESPTFDPCEHADTIKSRIMDSILEASCGSSAITQAGDESYDLASYLKALRDLYEWIDVACAKKEAAVAIVNGRVDCV